MFNLLYSWNVSDITVRTNEVSDIKMKISDINKKKHDKNKSKQIPLNVYNDDEDVFMTLDELDNLDYVVTY